MSQFLLNIASSNVVKKYEITQIVGVSETVFYIHLSLWYFQSRKITLPPDVLSSVERGIYFGLMHANKIKIMS